MIQLYHEDAAAVRAELLAGIAATPAQASPKYLYDALGSRLFEAITELPEYYPTRTEASIFAAAAPAMVPYLPRSATLVDLGAGNCAKAARLFECFAPARYVAVDISVEFLGNALACLQRQHPGLEMLGVGMDFSSRLVLPEEVGAGPRTLFYPGSSIGNFTPEDALAFLRQARAACAGGALVIGVDLVKDKALLEPAYDDPLQVTAAFNRNMLLHFNRLAGTDFRLADWSHRAFFDARHSRIEMHLVAARDLVVRWPAGERRFAAGETIHTENSYKWRIADFAALLEAAGLRAPRHWTDARGWFAVFVAQA
ncbi:MAG: L-histidine N(alpha)-methyltransferase [Burkholderiales bacterium]|nr:L-histidine N(alpha)-methyltransferase [Burkholderiales bacterium]